MLLYKNVQFFLVLYNNAQAKNSLHLKKNWMLFI